MKPPLLEFMAYRVMPFGPLLISVYARLFVEQTFCDGCVERISMFTHHRQKRFSLSGGKSRHTPHNRPSVPGRKVDLLTQRRDLCPAIHILTDFTFVSVSVSKVIMLELPMRRRFLCVEALQQSRSVPLPLQGPESCGHFRGGIRSIKSGEESAFGG
jgi:hypothetical protein